ncbi:MAG: phosphotransferase family protein [Maritimibacter sp.]|jgi:aminoglycoside phosphotransferase (APT) family kinase protein|uniref:phosphotransferase family protein n=1 Tax=Maritimibacter sp. TaxID=2003363 RepID=UPI001E028E87|nr:phosphotransferase family protein [Maritimibacter sp.]MBL6430121.1 phosphotransferase family protein [Maritimibacter sp.]
MSRDLDFDLDRLEAAIGGPLALAPVASGQSNPTWFVTRGDERMVLRKKPAGQTLSAAHAIEREYQIMEALHGSDVPVPRMILLEEDPEVIGTPFYLMEMVAGQVHDQCAMPDLAPVSRGSFYAAAAQVMAALHRIDWAACGLGGYGRVGDYYERQVRRWTRQWEDAGVGADPMIDELQRWFAANIPAASPTTIVHGDFRVGNLIHDADNDKIAAVLDWELSTLGDPLADLSHWMLFYDLAPDQLGGLAGLDLRQLGIPEPTAFLDVYRAAGGCTQPLRPFHLAFAHYRMAVIFAGIAARARSGQAVSEDAAAVGSLAPICAAHAHRILSSDRAVPAL